MALTRIRQSNITQPLDADLDTLSLSANGNVIATGFVKSESGILSAGDSADPYHAQYTNNMVSFNRVGGYSYIDQSANNATTTGIRFRIGPSYTNAMTIDKDANVTVDTNLSISNDLLVSGDFTVSGNTTFINSDNLVIEDLNIVLANGAANSAVADGAGITIDGANATLTWDDSFGQMVFNEPVRIGDDTSTTEAITIAGAQNHEAINFRSGSTDRFNIWVQGTGTDYLQFRDGNNVETLTLYENQDIEFHNSSGTAKMKWIAATERLGIGTDNPSNSLHIVGPDNAQLMLEGNDTNPTTILMDYNSTGSTDRVRIQNDAGDLKFLTSNGQVRQTILKTGKVGFGGIDAPLQNLAIEADANYEPPGLGNTDGTFSILKSDGNNSGAYGLLTGIQSSGDVWAQVQRVDGTATAYHLKLQPSGGKVGIGTTWDTPIGSLDVNGQIALTTTGTGSRYIGFYQDVVSAANNVLSGFIEKNGDNFTISNITNGTIQIANNGATRMRIANTGNVSIGGNNPYDLLWPDGSTGALSLQANAMMSAYNNGLYLSQNYYYNAGERYIANGYASRYAQVDGKHVFQYVGNNTNGDGYQFTSWNEGLIVDNNGYVGIGVGAPATNLEISSLYGTTLRLSSTRNSNVWTPGQSIGQIQMYSADGTAPTASVRASIDAVVENDAGNEVDLVFRTYNNSERLRITSGGNVGIGTDDPIATLVVSTNGAQGIEFYPTAASGVATTQYYNRSGAAYVRNRNIALDYTFNISGATDDAVTIATTGKVGIGDATPSHTLDVAGDINAQQSFRTDEVRHNIQPSFSMDFANSKTIPPEFVVRRGGDVGSYASYWDENGTLKYAPANTARITHDPATGECKGVILEKSQYNKLLESETFSKWDTAGNGGFPVRRVYNYAKAPDGSFNATRLMPSETTGRQVIYRTVSSATSTTYTASVFAKPDGYKRLQLSMIYGSNSAGWGWGFELDLNGVVGDSATYLQSENVAGGSEPHVEYVGDGWYRCSVTFTNSSSIAVNYFNIGVGGELPYGSDPFWKSINSYGNNQDGLLVWGAQFEESPFLSSYIPSDVYFSNRNSSKTYFDEDGVLQIAPANVATEGWNSPYQETHCGLDPSNNIVVVYNKPATIERYPLTIASPNRELGSANIFLRGIGGYSPGGNIGTVFGSGGKIELAVNEVAPDGTIGNVSKLTFANSNDRLDQQHGPAVNGSYYTISAWVKGTAGTAVRMSILHALGGNIEPTFYLTGEWQRISVTRYFDSSVDPNTTVRTHTLIIRDAPGAGVTTIDGQSAVYASEVLIWGIQLENTEFPTALIPTYGIGLTRADDTLTYAAGLRYEDQAVVYLKDTDWFNLKEGTIFADVELQNAFDDAATSTIFGLTNSEDQGTTNALVQFHTSSLGGRIWLRSGSSEGLKDETVGKSMRIATSYDASTVEASFVDGSGTVDTFPPVTRSNAIVPKYIMFNEEVAGGYQHGFTMKQFIYYPKALSTLSNLVEE